MKEKPTETVEATLPNDKAAVVGAKEKPTAPTPKELGGREGPEPTRYGEWEVKGIATDC